MDAYDESPEVQEEEFRRYETSSFFFCVIDQRRHVPAGVMRVIVPSAHGFKSLNDIQPVWGEPPEAADRAHRAWISTSHGRGTSPPWRSPRATGARRRKGS